MSPDTIEAVRCALQTVCETGGTMDELALIEQADRIAELKAENERLENLLAEGVHSCSQTCKRPMCVLRREKADLEQQLAALTDDLDAQLAQAMSVVKDREQQLAEMRREYDSLMDENISVAERNLILTSKLTALKEQGSD